MAAAIPARPGKTNATSRYPYRPTGTKLHLLPVIQPKHDRRDVGPDHADSTLQPVLREGIKPYGVQSAHRTSAASGETADTLLT